MNQFVNVFQCDGDSRAPDEWPVCVPAAAAAAPFQTQNRLCFETNMLLWSVWPHEAILLVHLTLPNRETRRRTEPGGIRFVAACEETGGNILGLLKI